MFVNKEFWFCLCGVEKPLSWTGEMAQEAKVLVAKPEDLSLSPSIHMVEGEDQFGQAEP